MATTFRTQTALAQCSRRGIEVEHTITVLYVRAQHTDSQEVQRAIPKDERGVVGAECHASGQDEDPVRLEPREQDHRPVRQDGNHPGCDGY